MQLTATAAAERRRTSCLSKCVFRKRVALAVALFAICTLASTIFVHFSATTTTTTTRSDMAIQNENDNWESEWLATVRSPPFATSEEAIQKATKQAQTFHLCETGVDPKLIEQQRQRYLPLRGSQSDGDEDGGLAPPFPKIYFAMNLHDSEPLIGDMAINLKRVFDHLGHENVFLSIYEDGSTDKTTEFLRLWETKLSESKIPHNFTMLKKGAAAHLTRIQMLAAARNEAMTSFHVSQPPHTFDYVLFLNDIYFCPTDILELVYQSILQRAHITCGVDVWFQNGNEIFCDRWVSRLINGQRLEKPMRTALSAHPPSQERLVQFLPLQVLAGWNGAVLFDARLFYDQKIVFREGKMSDSDCMACECEEACHDAWEKASGRIVMVPRVRPVYTAEDFVRMRRLQRKWPSQFSNRSEELIDFVDLPETYLCLSILPGAHGNRHNRFDFPGKIKKVAIPKGYNVRTDNLPFEQFLHLVPQND